ncbi:MAG: prolipoprotein diacylglyceryl transferase [Thermodesulfobacteriota bacterium]
MHCALIDPVVVAFGPVVLTWYGILWAAGVTIWCTMTSREQRVRPEVVPAPLFPQFLFFSILGVLIGLKTGHGVMTDPWGLLSRPWGVVMFWEGGRSIHGGILGACAALLVFCRMHRLSVMKVADSSVLGVPWAVMFVKIGNLINGESFGRVSGGWWGIVFPCGGESLRHMVQLYEALLQGPILFLVLWKVKSRSGPPGLVAATFVMTYQAFRFLTDFFREPDPVCRLFWGSWTFSQVLCAASLAIGLVAWCHFRTRAEP